MAELRGDFARLRRLVSDVEATSRSFPRLVQVTSEAALDALRAGMVGGTDPDGARWPRTTDGRRALAGLIGTWGVGASGATIHLESRHEHSGVHLQGMVITPKTAKVLAFEVGGRKVFARKVTIPQRRMVPRNGSLGTWATRLRTVTLDEFAGSIGVSP